MKERCLGLARALLPSGRRGLFFRRRPGAADLAWIEKLRRRPQAGTV